MSAQIGHSDPRVGILRFIPLDSTLLQDNLFMWLRDIAAFECGQRH
jgi:hypothetical protein